ncbi:hypothetical protein EDI_272060 [Entamoeba dispar SAW760]|uniref:SEC7 domain-containing protein n=1 Tax=Entamoeba dispar (strain ATCC PRA-260 / SAW760) TaxID=370354 RepID=B0EFK8_ENTDS|nr:uncharacterized protein EDI_272060 [Entamoeba dispar SAW760]EDR26690.1 hypothetical protein EDI_272060 [Entamoeba dispar SAW760]|eukprot:EDR26690.1 hypothetical protein EDI_272060 [Entamoeba dispar SAW760]
MTLNNYPLILKLTYNEMKEINKLTLNQEPLVRNHIVNALQIYEQRYKTNITEENVVVILTTFLVILQTKEIPEEVHLIVCVAMRKILKFLNSIDKAKYFISSFILIQIKEIEQKDKVIIQKLLFLKDCLEYENDICILRKSIKWFIQLYGNLINSTTNLFINNNVAIILECLNNVLHSKISYFIQTENSSQLHDFLLFCLNYNYCEYEKIYMLVIRQIHDIYNEYYLLIEQTNSIFKTFKKDIIPHLLTLISLQNIISTEEYYLSQEVFSFLNDIFNGSFKLKVEMESYLVQMIYLIEHIYNDRTDSKYEIPKERGDQILQCVYTNLTNVLSMNNCMAKLYINYDCDEYCTDFFQFFMMTLFKQINAQGYQLLLPLTLQCLQMIVPFKQNDNFDWKTALNRKKEWRVIGALFNDSFEVGIDEYLKLNNLKEKTTDIIAQMFIEIPQINKIKMVEYFLQSNEFNEKVFIDYIKKIGYATLSLSQAFISIIKNICLPQDKLKTKKLFDLFAKEYINEHPHEKCSFNDISNAFIEVLSKPSSFEEYLNILKENHCDKNELKIIFLFTSSHPLIVLNRLPTTIPTQLLNEEIELRESLCRKEVEVNTEVYSQFYNIFCNLILSALAKSEQFSRIEKSLYEQIILHSIQFDECVIIKNSIHQLLQLSGILTEDKFFYEPTKLSATITLIQQISKTLPFLVEVKEVVLCIAKLEAYDFIIKNKCKPFISFIQIKQEESSWFSTFLYNNSNHDKIKEYIKDQTKNIDLFKQLNNDSVIKFIKFLINLIKEVNEKERLEILTVLQLIIFSKSEQLMNIIPLLLNEKTFAIESFSFFELCFNTIIYSLMANIPIDIEKLIDFISSQPYEHFTPIDHLVQSFFENMTNNPTAVQRIVEKKPILMPIACNELLKTVNSLTVKTVCSFIQHLPSGKARDSIIKTLILAVKTSETNEGWEDCLNESIKTMILNHSIEKEWLSLCKKPEIQINKVIEQLSNITINEKETNIIAQITLELIYLQREKSFNEIIEKEGIQILLRCYQLNKDIGQMIQKQLQYLQAHYPKEFCEGTSLYTNIIKLLAKELYQDHLPQGDNKEIGEVDVFVKEIKNENN